MRDQAGYLWRRGVRVKCTELDGGEGVVRVVLALVAVVAAADFHNLRQSLASRMSQVHIKCTLRCAELEINLRRADSFVAVYGNNTSGSNSGSCS